MANHDVVDLVQAIDDTYARKGASGVPAGGDAGEVLRKKSSTDGDTEWADPMYHFDTIAHMEAALAQGLIPDGANITVEENSPTGPSGDSALSTTSENFVQNKVITLKINGMEAVIATVNTGTTADQAYAQGDFILMDGTNVLYKALSAIASGASFTTGSGGNVEQTTIGAVLKALASSAGATSLAALTDTTISSPTDKQPLLYDSASSKWINGGILPITNGGTGNADGYIRTGDAGSTLDRPGTCSTILGYDNKATGAYSSVLAGTSNQAIGSSSLVSGYLCQAKSGGSYSFVGGVGSVANNERSMAYGYHAETKKVGATAIGYYVTAGGASGGGANGVVPFAIGKCNNAKADTYFEIGDGTGDAATRHNLMEVHSDGRVVISESDILVSGVNVGSVELTTTCADSHAAGSYIMVVSNKKLYKVKSTALSPDDIISSSNCDETTIGEMLASLSSGLSSVSADLGSKSSASSVAGDDAFSKINTISSDLASKATGFPVVVQYDSHRVINAYNQSWTAPSDCWIRVFTKASGSADNVIYVNSQELMHLSASTNDCFSCVMPVKAGTVVMSRNNAASGAYLVHYYDIAT